MIARIDEPVILPLEADLHGEREHHVHGVDPVDVENVDLLVDDHRRRLVVGAIAVQGRGVLQVRLGHDHLYVVVDATTSELRTLADRWL